MVTYLPCKPHPEQDQIGHAESGGPSLPVGRSHGACWQQQAEIDDRQIQNPAYSLARCIFNDRRDCLKYLSLFLYNDCTQKLWQFLKNLRKYTCNNLNMSLIIQAVAWICGYGGIGRRARFRSV